MKKQFEDSYNKLKDFLNKFISQDKNSDDESNLVCNNNCRKIKKNKGKYK